MRALLVVSSDRMAGTERHVVDLAAGLRGAGVVAEVACAPGGAGLDAALRERGVPVHPLDFAGPRLVTSTAALALLARRFDVLHSHLTTATVAAAVAGLASRRPVVETRHFLVLAYETRGPAGRLAGRAVRAVLARGIALTIAPSEAARARAQGPSVVVPHGVEPRPAPCSSRGEGRFVTVGRLDGDRNCALLIQAFAGARPGLPAASTLTIVGDGTQRQELEKLAARSGVADAVTFVGWAEDPSIWLGAADVYLAAPFRPVPESFGLSVLEGMRAGLAVIAEPGGGAADLVLPEHTGLLVRPEPVAWAAAMARLAAEPQQAAAMGTAGRLRAESEFSLDRMVTRTIEAYRTVVGAGVSRAGARTAPVST